MNVSVAGIAFIREVEGERLRSYLDTGGVWTIGCGHTGKEVTEGLTCTAEQSASWLAGDLAQAVADVKKHVKVPLTQNQFDACTSFFYNLGATQLKDSNTLAKLNRGEYADFADAMLKWIYDNGKKIEGLRVRREKERALFLKA